MSFSNYYNQSKVVVFHIVFVCACVSVLAAQNQDSLTISGKKFYWQPTFHKTPLMSDSFKADLNFFAPHKKNNQPSYYDLRRVMPSNPFEWDYREGSYFQPQIVHDKMAQIMRRPSPDSFVPLPTIALLAASVALQYIDISRKIEIKASDYLIDDIYLDILQCLWNQPAQSAAMLFENDLIRRQHTMITLQQQLNFLQDAKLVKSKTMEDDITLYFSAQSKSTVLNLLKNAAENQKLTLDQQIAIGKLVLKLENE